MPLIACSPRHRWCGHVKAGYTRRKTAQIMLKWRACCLLPARRANGWRRRKPLIPRERRTAWRSCAGQRKHHEYFVSSRQAFPYRIKEALPVTRAAIGEEGRAAGEACAVLLAAAGQEPPAATPVRNDAPADLGSTRARRLRRGDCRKAARGMKQEGSGVRENSSERKSSRSDINANWVWRSRELEDQARKDELIYLAKCWVYKRRHPGGQNGNLG